jgi:hypothetical protein
MKTQGATLMGLQLQGGVISIDLDMEMDKLFIEVTNFFLNDTNQDPLKELTMTSIGKLASLFNKEILPKNWLNSM